MLSDKSLRNDAAFTPDRPKKSVYRRPEIIHELKLETRAGSPLGIPNPLDPAGLDPAE